MTKKIITILLSVMIVLSTVTVAFAAETPTVTVSSAMAAPGETVTLNVALSDNPGINTFSFGFDYDETKLSLTGVELASGIPGQFTYAKKAVWLNSSDITTNGNFLVLTFDVMSDATSGDADVTVTYNVGDIANFNEEDVDFRIVSGKVTVKTTENEENIDNGELFVGTDTGVPGETVTVPVSITKNPGINTFSLGFEYDTSKLELVDVEVAEALGGQFTYVKKAVWLNSGDTNYTGEILTLTFRILPTATNGDANVTVTYNTGDIANYDEEDVNFDIVAGKVAVEELVVYDTTASVGKVTGVPGDTVNVYISLHKETFVKSMSLYDIEYDSEKVTLINGEWIAENSSISDWNEEDETGVVTFSENTSLVGKVFLLTFEIKENAEEEKVDIDAVLKVTQTDENGTEKPIKVEMISGYINISDILRGDVDGNGVVDSNDAIHLLYHTLLPERYEINQDGDFDGDLDTDSDDAIYLLYFTMLPERYPLA